MQLALFGADSEPRFDAHFRDAQRRELSDGAWVEHVPGWLDGHERAFEVLRSGLSWRKTTQVLFEMEVETPRRVACLPEDGPIPEWAQAAATAIGARYGAAMNRISAALYRDGQDSVAWHRDRIHRERGTAAIAIVSLGTPRRFLLRPYRSPKSSGPPRASVSYSVGWGDLLVMGGTCQRTWQHAVPKAKHADPRIALMFRHDPDLAPSP